MSAGCVNRQLFANTLALSAYSNDTIIYLHMSLMFSAVLSYFLL